MAWGLARHAVGLILPTEFTCNYRELHVLDRGTTAGTRVSYTVTPGQYQITPYALPLGTDPEELQRT